MATGSSSTPQVTSKAEAKAQLKKLRAQQAAEKKARKSRRKDKKNKGEGFFARLKQVFSMTREFDPNIAWWMALAFLVTLAVSFGLFSVLLPFHWVTGLLIGVPFGLLAAMIVMNRRAEKAAFARIEGRPGASAAALGTLRRGWIVTEDPVAMSPKTQDAVFRVVGRPGLILVSEGPAGRVNKMIEKERRRFSRYLPNVPVHVIQCGRGDEQVPLSKLTKTIKKLPKTLTKHEVNAVEKRIGALSNTKPPIPKGVDPYRVRPDRKALRG